MEDKSYSLKSKLNEVIHDVYEVKSVDDAKKLITDVLVESKVNDVMKRHMLTVLATLTTLVQVQTYATNSILIYEGLGVGSKRKLNEWPNNKPANDTKKSKANVADVLANLDI